MDYIPGSVIRGAVAARILQESGNESEDLSESGGDFQRLFLSENPAIFQNAYLNSLYDDDGDFNEVLVLPATSLSSKTNSGFKSEEKNGVFDTLIDRFCAENNGCLYDPNCPEDGGRVEPYSEFYSKPEDEEEYFLHKTKKRLLTRTGINRRRATSEEEVLYSIEVINESPINHRKTEKSVVFCGSILVSDNELADSLQNFIQERKISFV
ncbi:hypothetical protein CYANOKiyG1_63640 [Okeania sp. KiyG1]|nr:hypothetical protein CYANOKiyG1_63640 [Okeania sp. KiyG1]